TGNVMTLVLLGLLWPFADRVGVGQFTWPAFGSALVILSLSICPLLLKKHVFSLPAATLRWVASIHGTRLVIASALTGLSWWSGMPGANVPLCFVVVTVAMLVGRFPLFRTR